MQYQKNQELRAFSSTVVSIPPLFHQSCFSSAKTEKEIISIFKELADEYGKTIIVVTHSDMVSQMSDKRVLLKDGKLSSL